MSARSSLSEEEEENKSIKQRREGFDIPMGESGGLREGKGKLNPVLWRNDKR